MFPSPKWLGQRPAPQDVTCSPDSVAVAGSTYQSCASFGGRHEDSGQQPPSSWLTAERTEATGEVRASWRVSHSGPRAQLGFSVTTCVSHPRGEWAPGLTGSHQLPCPVCLHTASSCPQGDNGSGVSRFFCRRGCLYQPSPLPGAEDSTVCWQCCLFISCLGQSIQGR